MELLSTGLSLGGVQSGSKIFDLEVLDGIFVMDFAILYNFKKYDYDDLVTLSNE